MDIYEKRCKDQYGGVKNFWLTPFVDYDETDIFVYDDVLESFPSTTLYKFDVEGDYSQSYNTDESWSQSVDIKLPELYGSVLPKTFKNTKYRVVVETNNGYYLMFGLVGGLDVSMNNASGAGFADFSGLELSFSGTEEDIAVMIDINDFFETLNSTLNLDL